MLQGLKKLRRLPHIFNCVLELPLHADADVHVEENPDHFRFVVFTNAVGKGVRTHTIEIYSGVTKIVVGSNILELKDELEVDLWRFRLPPSTRPELSSAVYVDGKLIVTVPKNFNSGTADDGREIEVICGAGNGDLRNIVGRLVLVQ